MVPAGGDGGKLNKQQSHRQEGLNGVDGAHRRGGKRAHVFSGNLEHFKGRRESGLGLGKSVGWEGARGVDGNGHSLGSLGAGLSHQGHDGLEVGKRGGLPLGDIAAAQRAGLRILDVAQHQLQQSEDTAGASID